jgi:putative mycofactocin binding protein MftB
VSTEPAMDASFNRQEDLRYTVSPLVRVRKEAFGLLFYNTENSRLTFVRSGDFLQIQALPNREKWIVAGLKRETQARVRKLFDQLLNKRLIGDS